MDYTSIHIYGHLLSDDILRNIEQDTNLQGNRDQDFGVDGSMSMNIDYAWSSLRNDWKFYQERSALNDPYGTRRARDLIERLLQNLGYDLQRQTQNVSAVGRSFPINYLCSELSNLPVIVVGERISENDNIETLDKNSLDYRAKGDRRIKSPHATMLEYLNSTENVYGIISNGQTLRLIRNSGQLVKVTYIEFDIRRMVEEDKYTEFCLLFRLLHASRFRTSGDEACIMERWFNMSIESGNRIRDGLSKAVQQAMTVIGNAAIENQVNSTLRDALSSGELEVTTFNKELIHFIYRLLFLFIIEDRNLVYQIPESPEHPDYERLCRFQDLYQQFYAASRLRALSESRYLWQRQHFDLWMGLLETFRLFESGNFGEKMGIKPLGGVLFNSETLHYLKQCQISNHDLLKAFNFLNEFMDERGQRVKINYSSLDVEEFGSVYEGILEMRPYLKASGSGDYSFDYVGGLDRKSTSSYYTRPDLVQNLIRTTLEPVIKEKIKQAKTTEDKVKALLSMKFCDSACGSGHIVLAMARTGAWYVCNIRTGEDNPASQDYREALREVIQRCVYAVDYNPDAVELCKVVLWIEGYCAGKPLSFLDHHIRCGNSVVGVTDLQMLIDGVPDKALTAEDRPALNAIKRLNKDAVKAVNASVSAGTSLFEGMENPYGVAHMDTTQISLADKVAILSRLPENTLEQMEIKRMQWEDLMRSPRVDCLRRACDIYTYAFYYTVQHNDVLRKKYDFSDEEETILEPEVPYTKTVVRALQEIDAMEKLEKGEPLPTFYRQLSSKFKTDVANCATNHRFFHWCVEFPEVFAYDGGFDVMCGNPPWDKIKVEDKKWFEQQGRQDIVNAGTAAQRKKAIAALETSEPVLFANYQKTLTDAESMSLFVRFSGRFPLTATGDIDLYPLFAEHCLNLSQEAWGLVLPTGIAVNDTNKNFFAKLADENRLISLYDFENKEALFDIHRMFKFCLLTAGKPQQAPRTVKGGFYLTRIDHLLDPNRIYTLQTSDFALLNPNTKTCPVFRTSRDANLTAKIYRHTSILWNEITGRNPWNVRFSRNFDMSNDSHYFQTYAQLKEQCGTLKGNKFSLPDGTIYVPLYEGKMIWHYNHHYGSWPTEGERPNAIETTFIDELSDPNNCIMPWYWVPLKEVENRLVKKNSDDEVVWEWKHKWMLGYRAISRGVDMRTYIISILPAEVGVGHSTTLLYAEGAVANTLVLATMSSLPFDYIVRQKVGGINMSIGFVKQFPILNPEQIPENNQWEIVKRVAELTYFNHDLDGWAEELYEELTDEQKKELPQLGNKTPWIFDPDRRAVLQAELDAIIAHLYGLSTEDLRYILDPEDVCGEGCINETFRVLKNNEIRQYGEYRTKRLVLEAWKRFGYDN